MLLTKFPASALTPNTRSSLFQALEKHELLELAEQLGIANVKFSDTRQTAQTIASKHWKMLEIEIQIHLK